jgi:hypothetical protein
MPATVRLAERAAAAGALGVVLLNDPLISLLDRVAAPLPGLYLYVFGAWAAVIALVALTMARPRDGGGGGR